MDQSRNAFLDTIAAEAAAALINTRQISPFSSRPDGLTIDDAYRVTPLVRKRYEARLKSDRASLAIDSDGP